MHEPVAACGRGGSDALEAAAGGYGPVTDEQRNEWPWWQRLTGAAAATRRRWFATVVVGLVGVFAGNALASRTTHADWGNTPKPYTMTYLGRPLHCLVVEDGATAGNIGGLTCDFVRYWRGQ